MNKKRPWNTWKRLILGALGVLLLADLALVFIFLQSTREGVESMRAQRTRLESEAKLLKADVARGDAIRASLPKVGKDCDTFYHTAFLDASDGYSAIESDLGAIATKAGLRTSTITFSQKEVKDRGVTLITVLDSVDGDYPAIIQFINGLERSKYFYLLNDLHLDTATAGAIRLHLELRTYFRT
ncbi:MAG: GspMb/PilO family protein [Candidatus Acidiferrales bacterium]